MKIKKSVVIVVLLLFPIIKPVEEAMEVLVGASLAHGYIRFLSIWDYLSMAICCLWLFVKWKSKQVKIAKYTKIVLLISLVFVVATLREFTYDYIYICRMIGNFLLITFVANIYSGKNFRFFLKGCYVYLTLLSILNAISIYIYSPGMYAPSYYLFGLDNMGFIIALHSFFAGMICDISDKGKIRGKTISLYTLIFLAYVYCESGTAIAMCVATLVLLMCYRSKIMELITYKKVLLILFVAFISITSIQNVGLWESVSNLLGKGNSFNGRTIIWAAMFSVIPKHLFAGFGIMPTVTQHYLGLYPSGGWLRGIGHMHNIVFEFLFRGGMLGLILFVCVWLGCISKMESNKDRLIYKILCVQLLFSMMSCMFEFRIDTYTFWMLPICLYEIESLK